MKPIRNSAKAVIIENNRLLLTKNKDDQGFYYLFPGGGQEKWEVLSEAAARECLEEIGCVVEVGDLISVREYIGKNHEFAKWDYAAHQVEFYFECRILSRSDEFQGSNPDPDQIGVEWIQIDRLHEKRIYPRKLAEMIQRGQSKPFYIGDAN
ncbi:NUDIX domain-containing protein [Paenibacillus montanisoli]|uniref:NUDIX hydrolase n=1 Tax=Paenibacillus montanisoli TaxID=2081970 RepID=A0A328U4H2_9BACL|nr:NUDIX domain-containing protein [Paenibacillus montanisoli]RAP77499.1 NUDIX hydrolase [Paenibacillus montanisoli]